MIKVKDIIAAFQQFAPFQLQESYDNSGLLVGLPEMEVSSALLCLDITEDVIDEAIAKNCHLVIAHHPVLFQGIKRLQGRNMVEKVIMKAIKHDIALVAVHTNLDNIKQGVNQKIAEKLGLVHGRVLKPMADAITQLFVYVPESHVAVVKKALFEAGAGSLGEYEECGFTMNGMGSFKPSDQAKPFLGEANTLFEGPEVKLEVVFPNHLTMKVLQALTKAHPYEEIAYGLIPLKNSVSAFGSGFIAELAEEMDVDDFLGWVKEKMKVSVIRHTELCRPKIRKVAICGGSGSFLLPEAIAQGADVFITADYKYHQFFDAEKKIIIADIGHFESEQFTPEIFYEILSKKFPTFALQITSVITNPVYYFK